MTFQQGESLKTVDITVNGDDLIELAETFSVIASAPTGGLLLGDDTGVVTIFDDDNPTPVTVTVGDITVVEGNAGLTAADVTISLSSPALVPITLDVSTVDGTATAADSDYQPITDQQVSFAVGEQSKVVTVNITGDINSEPDEALTLVGSNLLGSNVSFSDNSGLISVDNDDFITVSVADVSVVESNVGAKNLLVAFTLNVPHYETVVIDYTTVDGTATVADVDYEAKSGEVRFAPGVATLTRGITYYGDTNLEDDETFQVVLSNPINATIGQGIATITIVDDDVPDPALTVGDASVTEGDTPNTVTATVDLTLSEPATENVSFTLSSVDGTATAGSDYVAFSNTVSFAQGQQATTVDITINGDDLGELDEVFTLEASNPVGEIDITGALADPIGEVMIIDDDDAVTASVVDIAVPETTDVVGNVTGTINVDVTVDLTFPAPGPMSLDLSTVEGSALSTTASPDFVALTDQTVSFSTGETSKTVTVQVYADNIFESDETFSVVASNPTGGLLIADDTGEVTILDDDGVTVSVTGIAISEGNAGSKNAIVTFSLSNPSAVTVIVDYTTVDGTATLADGDYVERFGDVRIPPGATARTRGFVIVGDTNLEVDETFTVELSNPVNASIGNGIGTVTILNDEDPDNLVTVNDATVVEGNAGTTTVDVTITLRDPAASPVTIDVETLNGTAFAGTDYTAINPAQTVAFATGEQSQTVTLNVAGDTTPEANETFALVASNSSEPGVFFGDNIGTITIENDDLIDVSLSDAAVTEGAAATTVNATVDVSLSQPAIGTMSVDVTTFDGSATVGDSDYVATSQTVTFANGEQTKPVVIVVNGDDQFEADESFSLVANSVSGALNILDGAGEVSIANDDTAVGQSVVIGGATIVEPDSGSTVDALIDVTLSAPAAGVVTLDVASVDGTATLANSDYVAFSQTVTFQATEQTQQIAVTINGDDAAEFDEMFSVVGSNPSAGLTIVDGTGEIAILDNDQEPGVDLTLDDLAIIEGNGGGTTTATVTLNLAQPPVFPVSVDVSTVDGTATIADNDYTAIASQTVTFGTGEQLKTVDVIITADNDNESDEVFQLVASNPVGAMTIVDGTADITVLTDDATEITVGDVILTEGGAGYKWAQVPFTLSAAPTSVAETVTVQYTSVDGTATLADGDYELRTGELRFGNGVSSLTRGFKVFGDTQAESNETFTVEISSPVNAVIADGIGEVTVLDDDTAIIGLSVGDVTITEGNAGTSIATVDVTLNSPAVSALTVDVATADGTATEPSDYVAVLTQTLTFAANEQAKTVDITINGDTAVEADEIFTLVASNPSQGLELTDDTGQITIIHDDQPQLSIGDVTVTEGNAGTVNAAVTVDLDRAPTEEMTVVVSTVDGSATVVDGDYVAVGETLTFAIGEQSKIVNVAVNGDTGFETDEQFSVVATSPSVGLVLADDTGVVTITNDDTIGTLEVIVSDASVIEGNAGTTTTATVDVSLSFASPGGVTIDVATVDGTATAGSDYVALPLQTLTFNAGEQTKQLSITVNGDDNDVDYVTEAFTVVASNPTGGLAIGDGSGTVSILNDDQQPGLEVSVGDAQVVEGEAGTVIVSVPVTLNQPAGLAVSVDVATVDDSATTADSDYVAFATTVNFPANSQSATVDIVVNSDTNQELDETFNVVASNPSAGLTLGDDTGVVTIISDDGVMVSASDVTLTEINSGSRWAQMTFTLSAPPGSNTFVVDYATADGTATVADGDYQAKSGELRFAGARTTLTRGFRVYGDTTVEANETFNVVLSNPVNGGIADDTGVVTILDDDNTGIPLTVGDVVVDEGDAGPTVASVPLSLDIPALNTLTVDVSTVDGSATTADSDYTAIATQTVTFAAGEQFKTVDVTITGDTQIENTETLSLVASNASAGMVLNDDTGEITVTNDDFPVGTAALTVGDVTVVEGDAGTVIATVDLTLDSAPTAVLTVDVSTADGTATTADADYNAITAQTVTFGVGEQLKTVDIVINGDTAPEVDETFTLVASNPFVGMVLADDTGTVTIATDDAVTISAADVTLTEIDAGYRWAQVTFTLSEAPGSNTFIVDYATADGTATLANGDYEQRNGELKFVNNTTTLTRGFKVFGDTTAELDEVFTVNLSNPVNGVIADGVAEITILDDDGTDIGLSVGDAAIAEQDAGTSSVLVDLTLASAAVVPMTVDVATADGTATTGDTDYVATSETVSFAIGEVTKQVSIDITGDTNIEPDEIFTLVASNPSTGMLLTDDTGEITITNDDAPPTIDVSLGDVTITEGNAGQTSQATVVVTLSQNAVIPVSVDLSTADGTATAADSDFTAITNQTVQFATGESSKSVDVDIIGDDVYEVDETFQVVTSNESASLNVVDGSADITITNDDAIPPLSVMVGDATIVEGDAGTTNASVDVTLTSAAVVTVTVDVATADGTATVAGGDYNAHSETLTFAPGDSVKSVLIPVNGDTTLEGDEVFTLVASNPSANLDILDGSGDITITDDEVLTVSVGDQVIIEGDAPATAQASVALTLSEPAVAQVTVLVDTVDGTAVAADGDFVSVTSQLVTFPIGSSSQTVDITINGDDVIEPDETFSLVASAPSAGLSLGAAVGTVTIQTDDQPAISIDDVTLTELNAGYKWAQVRFSLSEPSTQTVQIEFSTVPGTATAVDGDYNTRSEILSFAPGTTEKFRGIQILGDTEDELDEFLTVELLSAPVNAIVGDGVGQITIIDNDN
ncbi:MAG: Calx-beta domain-containing protein [Acidimicrobiales bacterium]